MCVSTGKHRQGEMNRYTEAFLIMPYLLWEGDAAGDVYRRAGPEADGSLPGRPA